MDHDNEPVKCQCLDCGKVFNKGDEGDNEEFCLRCERISLTENMSQEDYDCFDYLTESDY